MSDTPTFPYILAVKHLTSLPAEASATQVNKAFQSVRDVLQVLVSRADDQELYQMAQQMIEQFGKADLIAYLNGESGALNRLKAKATESITLLP